MLLICEIQYHINRKHAIIAKFVVGMLSFKTITSNDVLLTKYVGDQCNPILAQSKNCFRLFFN